MKGVRRISLAILGLVLVLFSARRVAVAGAQEDPTGAVASSDAGLRFDLGCDAYRRADYAEARAHWRQCLGSSLSSEEEARVTYNLGNAAYRQGDLLAAVGWYTIALDHAPRDADLWHNLELVRAAAGLEPADRGDLTATLERLLSALLPAEARMLFALGLAFFLVMLAAEIHWGGRTWKRLACVAFLLCLGSAAPWLSMRAGRGRDPVLIVRTPGVALRSEPRRELSPTGQLGAGIRVERVDQLPGWVRVETGEGELGWVQESAVFELAP